MLSKKYLMQTYMQRLIRMLPQHMEMTGKHSGTIMLPTALKKEEPRSVLCLMCLPIFLLIRISGMYSGMISWHTMSIMQIME